MLCARTRSLGACLVHGPVCVCIDELMNAGETQRVQVTTCPVTQWSPLPRMRSPRAGFSSTCSSWRHPALGERKENIALF